MDKVPPDATQLPALLAAARLEKLNLEIEQLRNKGSRKTTLASYTPLISVLIAVGGFLFGIYQFQRQQQVQQNQIISEQQKDRSAKDAERATGIQSQIRTDVDQILQFPKDQKQTISKVSFLLEDLKSYIKLASESDPSAAQKTMKAVSDSLVKSVVNDCDFEQERDVQYSRILVAQWEDYGRSLEEEEDTKSLNFILSNYSSAAHTIYLKDPSMVRRMKYTAVDYAFDVGEGGKLDDAQTAHFQRILLGFKSHLKFLKDEESKKKVLIRLQADICNAKLMEHFFGVKYRAKDDTENLLGACPE